MVFCKGTTIFRPNSEQLLPAFHDALKGWQVVVKNQATGAERTIATRFVFLGAVGAVLTLLQKSGIPESHGYGGFPVSGLWLRHDQPDVVNRHSAKVYGKAATGSAPMSVPHLDTRSMDGKRWLLFGPYAGFSTKFLKHGSYCDLPRSLRLANLLPMLTVAKDNFPFGGIPARSRPADRASSLQKPAGVLPNHQ